MEKKNNTPKEIWEVINSADRILSIIDSRFDYDALCSQLALKLITKGMGKEHDLYFEGNIPDFASRLIDKKLLEEVNQNFDLDTIDYKNYDILVLIDTGNIEHISVKGDKKVPSDLPIVNVDHHAGNKLFGEYNYVREDLGAACSAFYELIKEAGVKADKEIAGTLMVGIYTDTGSFEYNTTSSKDLIIASELMDLGADLHNIAWTFNFSKSYEDIKLTALVFSNLRVDEKKRIAYSYITDDELKKFEVNFEKTSSRPSDMIKRLDNMKYVFVLRQLDDKGLYEVSIRAHEQNLNVLKIAKKFGGGGHNVAAGCNIKIDPIIKSDGSRDFDKEIKKVAKMVMDSEL